MKYFSVVLFLMSLLFFSGCSSISVKYDYDDTADFANYSTYKWIRNKNLKIKGDENLLDYRRVRSAVDTKLSSKGYVKKKTGETDLYVNAYTGKNNNNNEDPWNLDHYTEDGYYNRTNVFSFADKGTFVIDFIDGKTKQLVWRGIGNKLVLQYDSHEEIKKTIKEVVNKILENFPPYKNEK